MVHAEAIILNMRGIMSCCSTSVTFTCAVGKAVSVRLKRELGGKLAKHGTCPIAAHHIEV